jgi:hypothetical protein
MRREGRREGANVWPRTVGDVQHDVFVVKVEFPFLFSIGQIIGIFFTKGIAHRIILKNFTLLVSICYSRTVHSMRKYYSRKENFISDVCIFGGFLMRIISENYLFGACSLLLKKRLLVSQC